MDANIDIRVEKLLIDDEYIHYVLDPTSSLNEKWNTFFTNNPEYIPLLELATHIILGKEVNQTLSIQDSLEMKSRIFETCGLNPFN